MQAQSDPLSGFIGFVIILAASIFAAYAFIRFGLAKKLFGNALGTKRQSTTEAPSRPHTAPSLSQPIPPAPRTPRTIFISYRRQDSGDVTGRIYDRLVHHFGKEAIFKDVDSIPLGVDFREFLGDAVGKCNLLLAVVGRQWLNSQNESGVRRLDDSRDFVRIEIESALQRDIPVIPLLVQGAGVPAENDLPSSMRALVYRNAISIRPDPDFHHDIDRLITGVELHFKNNS
jgi:TIR domain-containing protein